MALEDVLVALHTVRFLRPRQVARQVQRRLAGPARRPAHALAAGIDDVRMMAPIQPPSPEGRVDEQGAVALLEQPSYDPLGVGWREARDPLWTYTLHYHGWLAQLSADDAEATILSWIGEHRFGVGWEPYPTSIRLLHWLAWLQHEGGGRLSGPRERILRSMAAQLEHLASHLEEHIDGNHLWTNLAALTACGLGLRGSLADLLVERFGPRLVTTVREQLSSDGVHRERTPSYHCLLAEQLAIVVESARDNRPDLVKTLEPLLRKMVVAMGSFMHPDGDVALFGDSQLEATVTPERLIARVGTRPAEGHALAPKAGFARRVWGDWTLLWTVGDVGLPWQTGHIHGDALAVEISLGDERVIVDAGVGTYVVGAQRHYARSTRAHNTVTVGFGAPNQHELWASHRIGRRAECTLVQATERRLVGRVRGVSSPGTHERTIAPEGDAVVVRDTVEPWAPATARWYVPRTAKVVVDGGCADVVLASGARMRIETNAASLACIASEGWQGMGRPAPRWCLATAVPEGGLTTRFVHG